MVTEHEVINTQLYRAAEQGIAFLSDRETYIGVNDFAIELPCCLRNGLKSHQTGENGIFDQHRTGIETKLLERVLFQLATYLHGTGLGNDYFPF